MPIRFSPMIANRREDRVMMDCLERIVQCSQCRWTGNLGKVIASDCLRCPECKSDQIDYLTPNYDDDRRLQLECACLDGICGCGPGECLVADYALQRNH